MVQKLLAARICAFLPAIGLLPGCALQPAGETIASMQTASVAHHAVLVEIGVISKMASAPERPAGPSLVAGDAIAWRWAMAYGKVPATDAPGLRFAEAD